MSGKKNFTHEELKKIEFNRKRKFTEEELRDILDSDEEYIPSDDSDDGESLTVDSDSQDDEEDDDNNNEDIGTEMHTFDSGNVIWTTPDETFRPRLEPTQPRVTRTLLNLTDDADELKCFLAVFPRSLFMYMAQCTNIRLDILRQIKQKKYIEARNPKQPKHPPSVTETELNEMMLLVGCMLVMTYNKVPNLSDYWSNNPSLGNETIKNSISRNRFQLLISKLYLNDPVQPANASKGYYIEELLACLKHTFLRAWEESPFQSIDESMTKFKGRSVLKQFMPLKPVKRGIKMWERCDSDTGYTYDLNIYLGKEESVPAALSHTTLGERVVLKLVSTLRNPDVTLIFDRFFTSISLLQKLQQPALGTLISNRKNVPKFSGKLRKGQCQLKASPDGVLVSRWQDSKDFLVASNCFSATSTTVSRKQKDGTRLEVPCPTQIKFYNRYMGGVDLSDQKVTCYDFGRKSLKWWKKVFYRLLMVAVVNAWIIHMDIHKKKTKLLHFLVPLAESLISYGKQHSTVKRRSSRGRPSKRARQLHNVGGHLPLEGQTRRRCARCSQNGIEKRTKLKCTQCNIPLCSQCFAPYHTS